MISFHNPSISTTVGNSFDFPSPVPADFEILATEVVEKELDNPGDIGTAEDKAELIFPIVTEEPLVEEF